jgi:hypothetical protein
MTWLMRTTCVSILAAAFSAPLVAQQPAPTDHHITLTNAQVSALAGGKVVVTMEAEGDLRGLVTFTLETAGSQITGGEWAFVARYVEYLDEDGHVLTLAEEAEHPHSETEPHQERLRFVDKGTVAGGVVAGLLNKDASGTTTGIDAVALSVDSGSLSFTGATGSGSGSATDLQDVVASSGSLRLTF